MSEEKIEKEVEVAATAAETAETADKAAKAAVKASADGEATQRRSSQRSFRVKMKKQQVMWVLLSTLLLQKYL